MFNDKAYQNAVLARSERRAKEQPMSDTLQKREDQMGQHQVNRSGVCEIPGCPCRGWSAQETASVAEPDIECQFCDFKGTLAEGAEHRKRTMHLIRTVAVGELRRSQSSSASQPAARGGGDEVQRIRQRVEAGLRSINQQSDDPYNLSTRLEDTEYLLNQHQSLVAERERLERMLAAVINAHYGLAYRSIGSGDGIPEKEAAEIGRWWLEYTASDA